MGASDRGRCHFLNSTCDIADHLSRALDEAGQSEVSVDCQVSHPRQSVSLHRVKDGLGSVVIVCKWCVHTDAGHS